MKYHVWSILALVPGTVIGCQRERHFHHDGIYKRQTTARTPLTADETLIVNAFDNKQIEEWNGYYTRGSHLAGFNKSQAEWTRDRWTEAGFTSHLAEYNVLLDVPVNKSLLLTYANGTTFHPSLEEDRLEQDETTLYPDRIPTFHGFSANGEATAEYVYVGQGRVADFEALKKLGVPLQGKIALARYGGPFRGIKVKNAHDYGMIAAVLFTDPKDDGNITEKNGYKTYPNGPARNPSSVQRGSVVNLAIYPGDVTTPGYASKGDDIPRGTGDAVLPKIPSIPISSRDVLPLLQALDGHGTNGSAVKRTVWVGGLDAQYWTGPAPGVTLNLKNYMRREYRNIWNTIGVLNGTNHDETVIVGNHRDAWLIGGAADPNSGSAILIETSKAFGDLLKTGWKPKRNLVLCSWDAEEYGLIGSTEWVEEHVNWIKETAVAYLNIDVGTAGPHPGVAASPDTHRIVKDVMKKVAWPVLRENATMYDIWNEDNDGEIGVLGSGSDYTAFLQRGVASIDMGADPGETGAVYHYHSNYDSFHWMRTFGDPGYLVHKAMGQYLALLAYHFASDSAVPLEPVNFATEMETYYEKLSEVVGNSTQPGFDTSDIKAAIGEFKIKAGQAEALLKQAIDTKDDDLLRVVNHKFRDFHRGFTSQGGLPDREFYQHLAFSPGLDTGYAAVTFPGVTEQIQSGPRQNFALAAEYVKKTAQAIRVAGDMLKT